MPFDLEAINQVAPGSGSLSSIPWETHGGYVGLNESMMAGGNGDKILSDIRKYDPDAKWVMSSGGGPAGEGGYEQEASYRLDYDVTKLPKLTNDKWLWETGFVPVPENAQLKDPSKVFEDSNYGKLTVSGNIQQEKDPWWVKAAPLAVGLAAPWAAGGLAGMGLGASGLTSAVTGSGLGAGASGALGTAISSGVKGLPGMMGGLSNGNYNGLLGAGLGLAGGMVPGMSSISQAIKAYQMAQMVKNMTRKP